MSAVLVTAAEAPAAPLVAMRIVDGFRRAALARLLTQGDEAAADVLVVDLPPGATLPADTAAFDGVLLILTDDAAVAADPAHAGVLRRDAAAPQVAAAVAALAAGLQVRSAGFGDAAPEFAAGPTPPKLLTPREVEVLGAVGDGLSNKAIARRLGISAHTVKYHLEAVFAKLGVRSRAEAVTRGLRLGVHVL